MAASKNKKNKNQLIGSNQTVVENRRARREYHLEETFTAGLALTGTEVKSLRKGLCSINEAYCLDEGGEIWLHNAHIAEYVQAGKHLQHDPKRDRKLLLHKREVNKIIGSISRSGYTVVPLRLFFDARGLAKLEIALAKGKKDFDKRESEKQRDWDRQKSRIMKDKG